MFSQKVMRIRKKLFEKLRSVREALRLYMCKLKAEVPTVFQPKRQHESVLMGES